MNIPLKGIIPPLVTPLEHYDKLDLRGLDNLIEHLISGGVHGLFILGTNGEAPSLHPELRKQMIEESGRIIRHRLPFLVGITDTSLARSLELAQQAKMAGADAVVLSPPFYYPIDQEEILGYFKTISKALPLPFYLYNIPSHTKIHITVDTVCKIKEMGAAGIKDSSGDMFYLNSLISTFKGSPDFSVFTGIELFLPETLISGGHGAVAGGANLLPQLFVSFYNAITEKKFDSVACLREKVFNLYKTIYSVSKHPSAVTIGIKCALSLMGICNDYMAPPIKKLDPEERSRVKHFLAEISNVTSVM